MNKLDASIKLTCIMVELEDLMWDIIEEIGNLDDEEHELQPLLDKITNMYEIYEKDVDIE